MSKAVMFSIQPRHCANISTIIALIDGKPRYKKSIEIRKTRPNISVPFKGYIYCTSSDVHSGLVVGNGSASLIKCYNYKTGIVEGGEIGNGKVIGEFICDSIIEYDCEFHKEQGAYESISIASIDEDWIVHAPRLIASNDEDNPNDNSLRKQSCLTFDEIRKYVGFDRDKFYGLHISNLVIYDKPKELGEFYTYSKLENYDFCAGCPYHETPITKFPCNECKVDVLERKYLSRPPQSWCYVEEA